MIPTFQKWLNLQEQDTAGDMGTGMVSPQPGQPAAAISDPQHTEDEESMDVSTLIQRRLEMLFDELERKRGMSREQMMQVLGQVMGVLAERGMKKSQMVQAAGQATGQNIQQPTAQPQGTTQGVPATPAQPQQ
jgi:hypothetical protein